MKNHYFKSVLPSPLQDVHKKNRLPSSKTIVHLNPTLTLLNSILFTPLTATRIKLLLF